MKKDYKDLPTNDFDTLKISAASPEEILSWSYGEVTKPETINYRTQKPERDGLFDEKIFGPTKDYECYCGKYKKIRYKGVLCDRCGVEVTRSSVRRERMAHIDLAVPVAHIWYVRGIPSYLGLALNLTSSELERVIYFGAFIILEINETIRQEALKQLESEYQQAKHQANVDKPQLEKIYKEAKTQLESLKVKRLINEEEYWDLTLKYGNMIRVGIGAEALYVLLKNLSVGQTIDELQEQLKNSEGQAARKISRRLRFYLDLKRSRIHPAWLLLTRLPVLPPDLRPMVQLDGGRFAASDLNDLYRRIINRNNRLKRLLGTGAPEVIVRNEKRMLQEAVDALIDNAGRKGRAITTGASGRKLRSLSDMLRGKQGRFRQNLLGKRVDYSGRSVIVIGPELKLTQCGLPKVMALELFKPFVIAKLIEEGYVHNVKNASRLIQKGTPEVWDILERVTKQAWVLLNRAPTLHRLGIQAFRPVLIEGKSIQIHPLVCYAYNADFDGDQMAVHVPLSKQAVLEAEQLMASTHNLLKPSSGEPVILARYDIVFGCFWLTTIQENARGQGKAFSSPEEAILAADLGEVHVRAKVRVMVNHQLIETSVGRLIFNRILPTALPYQNEVMTSKNLKKLLAKIYQEFGQRAAVESADRMKDLGFHYAGVSGLTISIEDLPVPSNKKELINHGNQQIEEIERQYQHGLITEEEKSFKIIETWTMIRHQIELSLQDALSPENPIRLMVTSGARGSFAQVIQMAGMKGLMVNPSGEIITLPVKSSHKEGLDAYEYFISTHGARKGKSDTSLRTSDAGYLTRRLVDVAQDVVIRLNDCGTDQYLTIDRIVEDELTPSFEERLIGRIAFENLVEPKTKKLLVKKNQAITESIAQLIGQSTIQSVKIRSPLTCLANFGLCRNCYGRDLATGELVRLGTAVGIIAAQAIGEPGTQLTMQTFHLGGVSGADITTGLPRVEELFEARPPKRQAIIAQESGTVKVNEEKDGYHLVITTAQPRRLEYTASEDYSIIVQDQEPVKARQILAEAKNKAPIRSELAGRVAIKGHLITVDARERQSIDYLAPANATILVESDQKVRRGQVLTDDYWNLQEALKYQDRLSVQKYIVREIEKIYASQGQTINNKHIEIITRQMFSKAKIIDPGDSQHLTGQIVDRLKLIAENQSLKKLRKKLIQFEDLVLGITRVSLLTDSFLSAASFQETTSTLIEAAIRGSVDRLRGLKENVIIGKLIPAGTGYKASDSKT